MRRTILLGLAAAFVLLGSLGLSLYFFERPEALKVAVERDSQDEAVLAAAAQKFAHDHAAIRLKLMIVDGLAESARALEQGRADLAVVRSDRAMPPQSASVLVMHPNLIMFVVPAGSDLRNVADLKGHKIGVLRDIAAVHGNAPSSVLETIFGQYDVPTATTTTQSLTTNEIETAIADKSVDAILAVGIPEKGQLADVVAAVTKAGHGEPILIPVAEAKAISERLPYFETADVVRGVFHGVPPKPLKTVETLSVSTRLVARSSLPDNVAASVTRLLLAAKPELATRVAAANRMESPSTDKDAALPVHPGVAAYLDDQEESFFDKYSDAIYISALCFSALGTAAAALAGRIKIGRESREDIILARLLEIIKISRVADAATLDALEAEADHLLMEALSPLRMKPENDRMGALGMAFEHVRYALIERRRTLSHATQAAIGQADVGHAPAATLPLTRQPLVGFEPRVVRD